MRLKKWLFLGIFSLAISSFVPEKEIKWVAIGDSITYLNDHLDETGNRVTKGYLSRVTEKLPYIQYTNQGHNGWTAIRIAKQIEKLGIQKADVYTVLLGTNDWWGSQPLGTITDYNNNTGYATVYGAFRVIINYLRKVSPQAQIILLTPMQRADFVYLRNPKNNAWGSYRQKNERWLAEFADAVKEIGRQEDLNVVDLYSKGSLKVKRLVKFKRLRDTVSGRYQNFRYPDYTTLKFNPVEDDYPYPPEAIGITYDGLHPSDKGNQVIAHLLVKVMKKLKF
ncbi:SGNH/GDSL hydrolase family protein [Mucilaginibacter sp. PAMB04168]|uniref:SGNH/GDSL hydrolase family protein n=1 Tax=Mucilaginibacter sp. PAMB04168 TaxID=3138567 RepID=UPI0031F697E9